MQIDPNNDPYSESVAITGNNGLCSGALITPDIVVTAGHCYCDGINQNVIFGTTLLPGAGQKIIPVDASGSGPLIPCDKLTTDIRLGDIAVLKLQQSAPVTPRQIINLPDLDAAASVRAVGFGRTSTGVVGVKYQVDIVIASTQCNGIGPMGIQDAQIYQCKKTYELVAAGLNRDTCNGDSGGAIYVFGRDAKLYLAGTTSRSVHPNGTCGPGGIYVVLSDPAIRPWLEKKGATFEQ